MRTSAMQNKAHNFPPYHIGRRLFERTVAFLHSGTYAAKRRYLILSRYRFALFPKKILPFPPQKNAKAAGDPAAVSKIA